MKHKNNPIKLPFVAAAIEQMAMNALRHANRSLRRHPDAKIDRLAANIGRFGFIVPIVINEYDKILAGEARARAAENIGLKTVPAIRVAHMSEAEQRAYQVADNKLVELSEWDAAALNEILVSITELEPEFDLELTGFNTVEIDQILDISLKPDQGKVDPDDDATDVEKDAVSRPGDIWLLDQHRMGCGDSADQNIISKLVNGNLIDQIVTDPPYNVSITGHVRTSRNHREFLQASGEMTEAEFEAFLKETLRPPVDALRDGALVYAFMDWRHIEILLRVGSDLGLSLINLGVWNKTNGGMGSFYRSKHELCPIFKKGSGKHTNNIQLGSTGRYRTNVWDYAGVNSFGHGRDEALASHPTVKPVAMMTDLIKDCTRRGDIVLDPFAGSGSTLIAAHRSGRIGYGMELDPLYVDLIIRRFEQRFGIRAFHENTGLTFEEIGQQRAQESHELEPDTSIPATPNNGVSSERSARRRPPPKRFCRVQS